VHSIDYTHPAIIDTRRRLGPRRFRVQPRTAHPHVRRSVVVGRGSESDQPRDQRRAFASSAPRCPRSQSGTQPTPHRSWQVVTPNTSPSTAQITLNLRHRVSRVVAAQPQTRNERRRKLRVPRGSKDESAAARKATRRRALYPVREPSQAVAAAQSVYDGAALVTRCCCSRCSHKRTSHSLGSHVHS